MPESVLRQIFKLSWPVFVAQIAHLSLAVTDTVVVGRFGTADLAGIAIGASIHVTVSLTLVGIIQALSPTIAHLHGAGRQEEIAHVARQGIWLALLLGSLGFALLRRPEWIVGLSAPSAEVAEIAIRYLRTAAWAVPAQMLYRTFYAFSASVGQPRPVMVISALGALLHVPLSYVLVHGAAGGPPLGAAGAAWSMSAVACLWSACAAAYLAFSPRLRAFGVFARWDRPDWRTLADLLRLGVPMGLASMIEISAFTLIALFVAPLGADVLGAHRITLNVVATCYMVPLALAYSLSVIVGQSAGARDWARARSAVMTGTALITGCAVALALAIALAWDAIAAAYTSDPAVRAITAGLVGYAALTHVFDATQTAALFALRGYKVTLRPMLASVAAFMGVGLGGGNWLAFHAPQPMGVAGFWLSAAASVVVATLLFGAMLHYVMRESGG